MEVKHLLFQSSPVCSGYQVNVTRTPPPTASTIRQQLERSTGEAPATTGSYCTSITMKARLEPWPVIENGDAADQHANSRM